MSQEYSGHSDYSDCYCYARRIRNLHKRTYAFNFLRWVRNGEIGADPKYFCSYMAAQAVRMTIRDLIKPLA